MGEQGEIQRSPLVQEAIEAREKLTNKLTKNHPEAGFDTRKESFFVGKIL